MKQSFTKTLNALNNVANQFGQEAAKTKASLIGQLSKMAFQEKHVLHYHDILLFLIAYPDNATVKTLAEKELKRITAFAKKDSLSKMALPENEGLPYNKIVTRFSPDFLQWLLQHEDIRVDFDSFYHPVLSLNDILNSSLPSVLKSETTAGLENEDLLAQLGISRSQYMDFIMGQFQEFNQLPWLKEMLSDRMMAYVQLVPKNEKFSRAYNRIRIDETYYHADLLKKFDAEKMICTPLPPAHIPDENERKAIYKSVRNAMALMVREIDPATFMQAETMRMYDVGRGLQFAFYSMMPNRQLPLETYFGFTFFKNGIPISYGGVWAFGKMAKLGLNVFEPFRLGESGYILCQLMRVCRMELGCTYFEVEPNQFGLNNPDGIKSGAFWFYYKYGFRPLDKELLAISNSEKQKIASRKNYRSSEKTLIRFTEDNIGYNMLPGKTPPRVTDICAKILSAVKKEWKENYRSARQNAIDAFCGKTNIAYGSLSVAQKSVLEDLALWAKTIKGISERQWQVLGKMVFAKTKDDYFYQQLTHEFFGLTPTPLRGREAKGR